jgi:ADP-L-glycero-D-manno-heptose 6-epimerase
MFVITGGAGFIGSNIAAEIEKQKLGDIAICDVLGMDDKWRNIAKRALRDIIHPTKLFEYVNEHKKYIEGVIHMGAISATTEKDADKIVENNFMLSRHLWVWCTEHNVPFIYASSAATYGDGNEGFDDFDNAEFLAKLRPLNPYGWSKHAFDRVVADNIYGSHREGKPPQWAGLKFFNVYGPNEYHKNDQMSVICKLYPQVVAGASARLFKSHNPAYEDGGQLRDFIYVQDCVDVVLWFIKNKDKSGLFNVGTGKARSFKDLAEATFKAAKLPAKIHYMDMPEELRGKYQYFTEANMNKLRSVGYNQDMVSLEDGVKHYVEQYMSRSDPYR